MYHQKFLDICFYIYYCRYSDCYRPCCGSNDHRKFTCSTVIQSAEGRTVRMWYPTRGQSWVQFKAGYYLFAILFLMFDIETVFLFPWAVVAGQVGVYALVSVGFFLVVLILGLAYAWRKGALEWK